MVPPIPKALLIRKAIFICGSPGNRPGAGGIAPVGQGMRAGTAAIWSEIDE
jgi:hypothetical protein